MGRHLSGSCFCCFGSVVVVCKFAPSFKMSLERVDSPEEEAVVWNKDGLGTGLKTTHNDDCQPSVKVNLTVLSFWHLLALQSLWTQGPVQMILVLILKEHCRLMVHCAALLLLLKFLLVEKILNLHVVEKILNLNILEKLLNLRIMEKVLNLNNLEKLLNLNILEKFFNLKILKMVPQEPNDESFLKIRNSRKEPAWGT